MGLIEVKINIAQWVFTEKPSSTAGALSAQRMTKSSYSKLQHRTTGPNKVTEVQLNKILVDEKGVCNTTSINEVSHAPCITPEEGVDTTNTSKRQMKNQITRGGVTESMSIPSSES